MPKKSDYSEYLQSPEWKRIRDEVMEWAGNCCQLCGRAETLETHHRDYARRGTKGESLDLIVLCHECHERHHKPGQEYNKEMEDAIYAYCLACSGGHHKEHCECDREGCELWRFRGTSNG